MPSLAEWTNSTWNGFLDLLYPPRCVVCRAEQSEPLCQMCQDAILPLSPPFCERCGRPIDVGVMVCDACELVAPPYAWSQTLGGYQGILKTAIHKLKYESRTSVAKPLGVLLARSLEAGSSRLLTNEFPQFDSVVPIPLHPSRYRERGFNQSELIAKALTNERGWKLDTVGVFRKKRTRSQTSVRADERKTNLAGAFDVEKPMWFEGQNVLIVDDVLTTSATLSECAKVVISAGAVRVCVVALAREL